MNSDGLARYISSFMRTNPGSVCHVHSISQKKHLSLSLSLSRVRARAIRPPTPPPPHPPKPFSHHQSDRVTSRRATTAHHSKVVYSLAPARSCCTPLNSNNHQTSITLPLLATSSQIKSTVLPGLCGSFHRRARVIWATSNDPRDSRKKSRSIDRKRRNFVELCRGVLSPSQRFLLCPGRCHCLRAVSHFVWRQQNGGHNEPELCLPVHSRRERVPAAFWSVILWVLMARVNLSSKVWDKDGLLGSKVEIQYRVT